jgi:hypothetical protein
MQAFKTIAVEVPADETEKHTFNAVAVRRDSEGDFWLECDDAQIPLTRTQAANLLVALRTLLDE